MWGKQNHEVSTKIIQDAADTQDLVHQMQRTPLFGINSGHDVKKAAIEWLVGKYESCGIGIDSLPAEVEESPYSCPDVSILRAGRRLSVDFLRTLAIAHDIRHFLQQSRPPLRVVELGAGLGHLARTLRLFGVSKSHILLDLPETLIFSYAFLTLNFPDASAVFIADSEQASRIRPTDYDFVFAPSCFAESIDFAGAELFVNTCSLGEMNNLTIRYWMDFVQRRMPVKYLFTQNRFLNTIYPSRHAWRWAENECSVHYDSNWTILKWDLEPPWYQCPYTAPLSARSLDIAATREIPQDPRTAVERSRSLLEEVKQEDWFWCADTPPDMTVRQNRFVIDVTMTGALFKLWESIRLRPTAEAVLVLLRYLETLIQSERLAFEETRYYQELFLKLAEKDERPDFKLYASVLRDRSAAEPTSGFLLVGGTQDYNILSADIRVVTANEQPAAKKYFALKRAIGPVDLFLERLGERELPGILWVSDTQEEVIEKAKTREQAEKAGTANESPECRLEGNLDGYNIVRTPSGYLALAEALGPTNLFQERIGERELAPVLLKASTYEETLGRITEARKQDREARSGSWRSRVTRWFGAT